MNIYLFEQIPSPEAWRSYTSKMVVAAPDESTARTIWEREANIWHKEKTITVRLIGIAAPGVESQLIAHDFYYDD